MAQREAKRCASSQSTCSGCECIACGLELPPEGGFIHEGIRFPACAVASRRLLNLGSRRPQSKTLWAHETCHAHTRIGIDRSLARMHWFREIAASLEHRRELHQFRRVCPDLPAPNRAGRCNAPVGCVSHRSIRPRPGLANHAPDSARP